MCCVFLIGGPAQPTNVTATVSGSILIVSWTYSDPDNVNIPLVQFSYIIAATSGSTVVRNGTAGPSERSLTVDLSELEENTQYNVELRAENLLGSTPAVSQFTTVTDMKMLDGTSFLTKIHFNTFFCRFTEYGVYYWTGYWDSRYHPPHNSGCNIAQFTAREVMRKKGAYTTDPAISNNPAYSLTKEKASSGNEEYMKL